MAIPPRWGRKKGTIVQIGRDLVHPAQLIFAGKQLEDGRTLSRIFRNISLDQGNRENSVLISRFPACFRVLQTLRFSKRKTHIPRAGLADLDVLRRHIVSHKFVIGENLPQYTGRE